MISVFLRRVTGKGQKLLVGEGGTVKELLKSIEQAINKDRQIDSQFDVFYRGERLGRHQDMSMQEAEITANAILHIVDKQSSSNQSNQSLRIKLILQQRLLEYQISQAQTVGSLKKLICQDLGIKYQDDLTLSFIGVELDNDKTIREYQFVQDILISAAVVGSITLNNHRKSSMVSNRESQSEQSQGAPKIGRESAGGSPLQIKKKTQSMNVEPSNQLQAKNVFASVNLNSIDESRNQSLVNQSEQISQSKSGVQETGKMSMGFQKPKLTLDSLSKPWPGTQKIIETQSIVDEDEEESFMDCIVEFIRTDLKKQYVFEAVKQDSFAKAAQTLADLQKVSVSRIKLIVNFDEVSRSGISSRSSKAFGSNSSPRSANPRNKRNSLQSKQLLKSFIQYKDDVLKMVIIDYASRLKKKELSFEYQLLAEAS